MTYTITPEDTLSSVSQKFDIPMHDLLAFNQLESNSFLFPGMVIIIPPRPIPPVRPNPPQNRIYVVRRGDTIWSIARKFNVSVQNIMFMNHLQFPIVFPGQRLVIPMGIVPL